MQESANTHRGNDNLLILLTRLFLKVLRDIFSFELLKHMRLVSRSMKINKDESFMGWARSVQIKSLILFTLPLIALVIPLVMYLSIERYNISSIDEAYIKALINGTASFTPLILLLKISLLMIVSFIPSIALGRRNNSQPEWIAESKELKRMLTDSGYMKKNSKGVCLHSPYGLLVSFDHNNAKTLIDDENFWTQADIFPGKVINLKARKEVFIKKGFRLEDSYVYDIEDLDPTLLPQQRLRF